MEHQELLEHGPVAKIESVGLDEPEQPAGHIHPEVWIGTRSDYEGERRHGGWIDVARREPEVLADIRVVVDGTPGDLGQAWGMFDARGFGYWQPTGEDRLATVMAAARHIVQFGLPYSALVAAVGPDSLAVQSDRYQLSYVGDWPSLREFANQVATDSGWYERLSELPRGMQPYVSIDLDGLMEEAERQLTVIEHNDGVWVFDPRVW